MPCPEANRQRKAEAMAEQLYRAGLRANQIQHPTKDQPETMGKVAQILLGTQKARVPSKATWQDTLQALRHLEDEERWK